MKRKGLLALFLSVACGVFATILFEVGILESLELKTLDFRFRLFARPERASRDVVIVAIDEKSLQEFKRHNIVWKWPRDFYAALVRYLHRGGAKVIAFDILFADADIDRLTTDAEQTDGEFARAMREAGNVLLGVHMMHKEDLLGYDNPLVKPGHFIVEPTKAVDRFEHFSSTVLPIPLFQYSASALGATNYREDPQDGVCRRLPLFFVFQDEIFPQLGMAAYLIAKGIDQVEFVAKNSLRIGDLNLPIDEYGQFLISWYGKGGPDGCFNYYSIGPLISSAIAEENNRDPIVPSSIFKNKIIIVGSNAPALSDFRNTPFTVYEPYPAMEIYATMISNFLQRDFLTRVHSFFPILAIFIFAFIISYVFVYLPSVRTVVFIAFFCAVGWFLASLGIFHEYKVWMDIIAPEVSILIAFSVTAVVSYQTEGKARRQLRSVFNRYLSPVVISEILEKSERVELGGRELTGTVYFSDIQGFTNISEQISASELVALLNEYFSIATDIILRNEGLLDKYIGDAIMAIFGAPIPNTHHAVQACTAALEVQRLLKNNFQHENNYKPRLETRIGIHTGSMVVGNIGSKLRLDYTAIGDTVNLASRLEGVNKIFATNILISDSTFQAVKDVFFARELDILYVKGRKESVVVYELLCTNEEISEELSNKISMFSDGIRWYRDRNFERAIKVFESILSSFPNDGPSQEYVARCQRFITSPPSPDWDGVFKLEIK